MDHAGITGKTISKPQLKIGPFEFLIQLCACYCLITALPKLAHFDLTALFKLLIALPAICLLYRPKNYGLQILLPVAALIDFVYRLPLVPNHDYLTMALFIALLYELIFSKKLLNTNSSLLIEKIQSYTLYCLIIVYFFTIFHKLNSSFFNTEVSCAKGFYNGIKDIFPFFPPINSSYTLYFAVLTIAIESILPILLLLPSTRWAGGLLAALFHGFLALRVETFSFLIFIFLYIFFYETGWNIIQPILQKHKKKIRGFLFILGFSYFIVGFLYFDQTRTYKSYIGLIWTIPVWLIILQICWSARSKVIKRSPPLRLIHLALVFLLFLNGTSPYFGFKTATAFSMFSNLRTEVFSNHLLVKETLNLWNDQNELYQVFLENKEGQTLYIDNPIKMSKFEIRRLLHHKPMAPLPNPEKFRSYVVDQNRIQYLDTSIENIKPPFHLPIPFWERKLRIFRNTSIKQSCQW